MGPKFLNNLGSNHNSCRELAPALSVVYMVTMCSVFMDVVCVVCMCCSQVLYTVISRLRYSHIGFDLQT